MGTKTKATKPVKVKQSNKIVFGRGKPVFSIKSVSKIIGTKKK